MSEIARYSLFFISGIAITLLVVGVLQMRNRIAKLEAEAEKSKREWLDEMRDDIRMDEGKRLRNAVRLLELTARDNLDALAQCNPVLARRIVRELHLDEDESFIKKGD